MGNRSIESRISHYEPPLDDAEVGVLLLDEAKRPAAINSPAEKILTAADGLTIRDDAVVALIPEDQRAIEAIFVDLDCSGPDEPDRTAALLIRRPGRAPLTMALSTCRRHNPTPASYMVLVIDPERDIRSSVRTVCELYRMTRAETEIAAFLVDGATLAQAARAQNLQLATARAYLKQIFARTGVHRQAELVHLLLTSRIPRFDTDHLRVVAAS